MTLGHNQAIANRLLRYAFFSQHNRNFTVDGQLYREMCGRTPPEIFRVFGPLKVTYHCLWNEFLMTAFRSNSDQTKPSNDGVGLHKFRSTIATIHI